MDQVSETSGDSQVSRQIVPGTRERMRADDWLFCCFLMLLLIAPRIKVPLQGAPELSAVSLGFVGFFLWVLRRPVLLYKMPRRAFRAEVCLFVCFALYTIIPSVLSGSLVSVAYAVQYAFYVVATVLVVGNYIAAVEVARRRSLMIRVLVLVFILFSLGALLSIWIGPIYKHQTQWTARLWGGMVLNQAVGFTQSQNQTGGLLAVAWFLVLGLHDGKLIAKAVILSLFLCSLMATLSRGALASFFAGLLILRLMNPTVYLGRRFRPGFISLCAMLVILCSLFFAFPKHIGAVMQGLGVGTREVVVSDLAMRLSYWQEGLNQWLGAESLTQFLLGRGFRSSSYINQYGVWTSPHNLFISFLAEFGLLGTLLFFASSVAYVLTCVRAGKDKRWSVSAIFAAYCSVMTLNVTGLYLYSPAFVVFYSILLMWPSLYIP